MALFTWALSVSTRVAIAPSSVARAILSLWIFALLFHRFKASARSPEPSLGLAVALRLRSSCAVEVIFPSRLSTVVDIALSAAAVPACAAVCLVQRRLVIHSGVASPALILNVGRPRTTVAGTVTVPAMVSHWPFFVEIVPGTQLWLIEALAAS
ncbi:hypothetical protein D3C86_1363370 [compost metagenome]